MKNIILKNIWILLIIVIIPVIIPLFHGGFFSMHDDEQIARLYELDQSVKVGDFPPRWVSHLGFGYGYPLFNFYPPFVYYFLETFHLLGFSLIDSTKIVMALGFFLSGLFMFLWVRRYTGNIGGFVAAVLYIYAPYHGVDLYVRGAFAEFFSFVWIPAVFWALDNFIEKKNVKWGIISSIFLSFIVLTHNLVALAFIFFLVPYIIFILVINKNEIKSLFPKFVIIGVFSLGISAYFWLPALAEKKFTLVDTILTKELASYKIHFVNIMQFWNSSWGYGGSIAGPNDGLSFQVGKFQLLLPFFAFLASSFYFIKRKEKRALFYIGIFIFFLFSLFMATSFSKPIWDIIQPLSYLQFPWRFLEFSAAFASFLSGLSVYFVKKIFGGSIALVFGIIIIFGSIILVIRNFHPQTYLSYSDTNYTTNNDIEWRVSKMSFEYVPYGVATYFSSNNNTQLDINKNDIPNSSFDVINGDVNLKEEVNNPSYKRYESSGLGGEVTINTYMFPGWNVYIDGQKQKIEKYGKLKLISFSVDKGNHIIEVKFENTQIRTFANLLTGFSLFILAMAIFYGFFRNNGIIKSETSKKS